MARLATLLGLAAAFGTAAVLESVAAEAHAGRVAAGASAASRASTGVVINEYQASNVGCLHDGDWNTPDWIELYNASTETVNLAGYGLSQDEDDPYDWVFPEFFLPAGGRVLVYASDRDRTAVPSHWETIIDSGDPWRYRVNTSALPAGWHEPAFADSAWDQGPSGFGYADGDDGTIVPQCRSLSARRHFTIADTADVRYVCLQVDFDDGFVAWLNGEEIARRLVGTPGIVPAWNDRALGYHEAQLYQGYPPEMWVFAPGDRPLRMGANVLAIEVHNHPSDLLDLSLIPILTIGLDAAPPNARGVPERIRHWLPHLETDFKISAAGETIVLVDRAGHLLDRVETGEMPANASRGRVPDGGDTWRFFETPTPDAPNEAGQPLAGADRPGLSPPGGFYSGPLEVTITTPTTAERVTYTLDASEPTESSPEVTAPILIDATTVVRARAFETGNRPSAIATATYVMENAPVLPVFCLVTDPVNLWDEETGIYVTGPNAWPTYPYWGANYWQDWERPVHVEFLDPSGPGFRFDLGLKIHGGTTRTLPQKPLRLIARGGYETEVVAYPLYPDRKARSFKRIVLRNAGNDWCLSHLRDGLLHRLAAPLGIDTQAYRPARVYLNGQYWGILNMREQIDAHYLEENYGADPDAVDLLEKNREVLEGDTEHYDDLVDYIESHDVSQEAVFAEVARRMDTEEFAAYYVFRILAGNTDWPGNNLRYWRPRTGDGRWRWILYDAEWGLGLNDSSFAHNTLAHALVAGSTDWQNAPWSTFLARRLLENEGFRRVFINTHADYLNSVFRSDRALAELRRIAGTIEDEIPRHMERWGFSAGDWSAEIATIEEFLRQRPGHARAHLMARFALEDTFRLTLDVYPPGAGSIHLTAIDVDSAWAGTYYTSVPVRLTARPTPGWRFKSWSDESLPPAEAIDVNPVGDYAVIAEFAPDPGGACYWLRPAPNPVRAGTGIRFFQRTAGRVTVEAFDVAGRRVATLAVAPQMTSAGTGVGSWANTPTGGPTPAPAAQEAREHAAVWTGVADDGRPLPSGVYFLRLEAAGDTDTRRVIVAR